MPLLLRSRYGFAMQIIVFTLALSACHVVVTAVALLLYTAGEPVLGVCVRVS